MKLLQAGRGRDPARLGKRQAASVNDKDRRNRVAYKRAMKLALALLALLLLTAAAPAIRQDPIALCPVAPARACKVVDLSTVRLDGPGAILQTGIRIDPAALPLARPLMVRIIALASGEVRWNGVLIGTNGVPGGDAASETPGLFVADFVVPPALVRPGLNVLRVRLSAHHLWLPVRTPVHMIAIGPYETPNLPGLTDYLPALLTLGALAAALAYFGATAWGDRRDSGARLLAGIAGAAILQLGIEVVRAFVAYTYPWHLARVAAIALLAALTALLAAAYAGRRFAPAWRTRIVAAVAVASLASLLLLPWYDLKALGAILAGLLALAIAAARGLRDRRPGARAGLAAAMLIAGLMAWQRTAFLDRAYYVGVAAVLVALIAEQVGILRGVRRRGADLEERLRRAEEAGETILQLKDGGRVHRVAESDIMFVKAADDYCEAVLADGRTLLVTMTLARLLEFLPAGFVRIHKSYAVNRAHVASVAPRPAGGRQVLLVRGGAVPVGRSYAAALAALVS
jgi:DNA-binding LytR/AlgR family response regulator